MHAVGAEDDSVVRVTALSARADVLEQVDERGARRRRDLAPQSVLAVGRRVGSLVEEARICRGRDHDLGVRRAEDGDLAAECGSELRGVARATCRDPVASLADSSGGLLYRTRSGMEHLHGAASHGGAHGGRVDHERAVAAPRDRG